MKPSNTHLMLLTLNSSEKYLHAEQMATLIEFWLR